MSTERKRASFVPPNHIHARHNVNWHVGYRPNDHTQQARAEHYGEVGMKAVPAVPSGDGYVWTQMHGVMHMYGPAMRLSSPPPFETEMLVEVELPPPYAAAPQLLEALENLRDEADNHPWIEESESRGWGLAEALNAAEAAIAAAKPEAT